MVLFGLLGLILPDCAYSGAGTASGAILMQPVGGRANGMADAYVCSAGDVFGIFYNPGASIATRQAGMLYQTGIAGDIFGGLGASIPLSNKFRIAVSALYYTAGAVELIDTLGNESSVNGLSDMLAVVSPGVKLGKFNLGANLKYLSTTMLEEFKASSMMVDFGGTFRASKNIKLGAAVQNIGQGIKYIEEEEKLPQIIRAGASYSNKLGKNGFLVEADLARIGEDADMGGSVGMEYSLSGMFFVRGGYKVQTDANSYSIGAGFKQKEFGVDYAFVPCNDLGNVHRLSVALKF